MDDVWPPRCEDISNCGNAADYAVDCGYDHPWWYCGKCQPKDEECTQDDEPDPYLRAQYYSIPLAGKTREQVMAIYFNCSNAVRTAQDMAFSVYEKRGKIMREHRSADPSKPRKQNKKLDYETDLERGPHRRWFRKSKQELRTGKKRYHYRFLADHLSYMEKELKEIGRLKREKAIKEDLKEIGRLEKELEEIRKRTKK